MSVSFLFYSHSDNKDLWHHISEVMSKLPYRYNKYLAIESGISNADIYFEKTLYYDDTLTYDKKLISLFEQIDEPYVVLIHENDLLIEFDENLFIILFDNIKKHNIDRCIFGVAARDGPNKIHLTEEDTICKINNVSSPHFLLPYDVGPSIWKVQSYKDALKLIPNTSYRDIESSPIREYCIRNLNMYGFVSHSRIPAYYVIGRPFYYKFQFLHIFVRRQLMLPQMYMDQEVNLIKLLEKYPEIKKRPVHNQIIDIRLRTV